MTDAPAWISELESHVSWSGGPAGDPALSLDGFEDPAHVQLLKRHDGLVAFDGALRVFGVTGQVVPDIASWNTPDGWRAAYRELAERLLFFAEDVFGNQFAFAEGRIVRFLAETGEQEFMADSFEEWVRAIIADPDEELSLWLLRSWRTPGNTVQPGEHLCPKVPFVVGGAYEPENLYVLNRAASMDFKGDFASQTKNVPDGGKIRLKIVD
jgi:SMI1/KNR4 family protein SUKH-1